MEFMENLFAENNNWCWLHASRNCRKFVYCSWAIRVNHATEHLCCVVILNLFKSHTSFGERIISFGRAETNDDKVASPKQQSVQWGVLHIAHNLHKLPSRVFLRITSENVRPSMYFMKKYSSYIFYWITVGVFFQRNFVYKGRCAFCFILI